MKILNPQFIYNSFRLEIFVTFASNESMEGFISKILFIFQKWKDYRDARDLRFPGFYKKHDYVLDYILR